MSRLIPSHQPIAAIIEEMIEKNPDELNGHMAQEASRRLGKQIDSKTISFVRNRIGLGAFQQIEREYMAKFVRAIDQAYKAGLDSRQ